MQSRAEPSLEELNGLDEGDGVGTKVGEKESKGIHDDEEPLTRRNDLGVCSSENDHEYGHRSKTLHKHCRASLYY